MIRFIDLFAGIGGTRIGLEQACKELGIESKCVISSEIDENACSTYKENFGDTPLGDVRCLYDIPEFDFLLAGFPCQPFSYAGKQEGFADTRGTLFFEIERILRQNKPKGFLLENVRGLTSHDKGRTFKVIIRTLEDLGYGVTYLLLNSSNFGVPQNRVRIYILGLLGEKPVITITSDKGASDSHKYKESHLRRTLFDKDSDHVLLKDILEHKVMAKYICSKEFIAQLRKIVGNDLSKLAGVRLIDYRGGKAIHSWDIGSKGACSEEEKQLMNRIIENRRKKVFGKHQDGKRLSIDQIKTFYNNDDLPQLLSSLKQKGYLSLKEGQYNPVAGNMSFEVYKFLDPDSISITLVASDADKLGVVIDNVPRRITPREAARLQGFPENYRLNHNDRIAYLQLGNSVTIPVIKALMKDLIANNEKLMRLKR